MGTTLYLGAVNVLEKVVTKHWNPLGLRLEGLTAVSRDNLDAITPIVDELMIKYTSGMYMSPEMRLVCTVGAMIATVHAANTDPSVPRVDRASAAFTPPAGSQAL